MNNQLKWSACGYLGIRISPENGVMVLASSEVSRLFVLDVARNFESALCTKGGVDLWRSQNLAWNNGIECWRFEEWSQLILSAVSLLECC